MSSEAATEHEAESAGENGHAQKACAKPGKRKRSLSSGDSCAVKRKLPVNGIVEEEEEEKEKKEEEGEKEERESSYLSMDERVVILDAGSQYGKVALLV